MIYNLIRTNSLLSNLVERQNAEIEMNGPCQLSDHIVALGKKGAQIARYKGLGEMNPETLWETTLDPELRTLLRVTADDEQVAQVALVALMGSDPSTRYRLICDNAEALEVDV